MKILRDHRLAQNLTLEDLSERSDVPLQTVRYAEMTDTIPRLDTCAKICRGLGISLDSIA